jgi:hypothetical protein
MSQPLTLTHNTHTPTDVEIAGRALYALYIAEARERLDEALDETVDGADIAARMIA